MNFRDFTEYFDRIESVSSRIEMTGILADMFKRCKGDEISIACYLMIARVAPMFIPIEFNVAEKTLRKALETVIRNAKATYDVGKALRGLGDIGNVAEEIVLKFHSSSTSSLTLTEVYEQLWRVALLEGTGSSDIRQKVIVDLINHSTPIEAKYIMRILSQRLRLGAASKTVLDALSVLGRGDKVDHNELERAYGVCADLGYIAQVYVKQGVQGLKHIGITPGIPVLPMLVEREKDAEGIMNRMEKAIVQPKFDGIRCQIHIGVEKGKRMDDRVWWKPWKSKNVVKPLSFFVESTPRTDVKLFSRNLEDMTDMFPEIVMDARKLRVESAVLDAEIVGFNDETGEYSPFQETMTRKRKYNIEQQIGEVPVRGYVFDILYKDGKDMIHMNNLKRVEVLTEIVGDEGLLYVAGSPVVSSAKGLEEIFRDRISEGLEGVVVKNTDSFYEPGVRGFSWLKLKRAFQGHLADTVDVVALGYFTGRGKQSLLGIGAILAGIYNSKEDRYETITKIGTGITEQMWRVIKHDLDKLILKERPGNVLVGKALYPDVWVRPEIVLTVEADEITRSPIHTAGLDKQGAGYALRFPRLKVWRRDKLPEDATSILELKRMYETTGSKGGGKQPS